MELVDINKSYGQVKVLSNVNLRISSGEIVAVAGENGAGKSTLMNIVYGLSSTDSGSLLWQNKEVRLRGPNDARRLGIGMVMQHFSLFESMTVLENLYLYISVTEDMSMKALYKRAGMVSQKFGFELPLNERVSDLSVGDKQRLEILKCLLQNELSLLILDEPTAMLSDQEAQSLMDLLRRLSQSGCAVLYVSHKLKELVAIADRVNVLTKGCIRDTLQRGEYDEQRLMTSMLGELPSMMSRTSDNVFANMSFELKQVETEGRRPLRGIDLRIGGGEILGIAGISGNGQEELVDVISGELPAQSGELCFCDSVITRLSLCQRYQLGLTGIVSDRNHRSSASEVNLVHNYYLKYRLQNRSQLIDWKEARDRTRSVIDEFQVAGAELHTLIGALSGGNRQKFIMGRELSMKPKLVICHQPTWGVDLKSAAYIYSRLKTLADEGAIVIIISEDLDELYANCDSLAVLFEGRLSPIKKASEFPRVELGHWLSGASFSATESSTGSLSKISKRGAA